MTWKNRIIKSDIVPLNKILPNAANWRKHPDKQKEHLKGSLDNLGWIRSVLVNLRTGKEWGLMDRKPTIIDGHLRLDLAVQNNEKKIPVEYVDLSPDEEKIALASIDPLAAMAEIDKKALDSLIAGIKTDDPKIQAMLKDISEASVIHSEVQVQDTEPQISRAEELRKEWGTGTGQMWQCGEHRVICGDCTDKKIIERLMGTEKADCLLTDPPYCSGGFQEAGKKSGSIGTRGTEMIANDTLSTRGYIALIKSVLCITDPAILYIFTDWRMWVNLFDCVESSGFGVRNMIVWDKGTPGMGRGWRSQHELIMCGTKISQAFDPHKAQGNVIQCTRTGNVNHPTEKNAELLGKILDVTDMAKVILDPFLGSGTTMIACENLGRKCRGCEIDPGYVAVILQRYKDTFPDKEIRLIG